MNPCGSWGEKGGTRDGNKVCFIAAVDKPQNITQREKQSGGQMGQWQIFAPNQQNAALWISAETIY